MKLNRNPRPVGTAGQIVAPMIVPLPTLEVCARH